jgi:hypothetical protein
MCEVRSKEKITKNKPQKKWYNGQQQKEMDCDEPHLTPNEKMQPIQWTERPTGALVATGSLWPTFFTYIHGPGRTMQRVHLGGGGGGEELSIVSVSS